MTDIEKQVWQSLLDLRGSTMFFKTYGDWVIKFCKVVAKMMGQSWTELDEDIESELEQYFEYDIWEKGKTHRRLKKVLASLDFRTEEWYRLRIIATSRNSYCHDIFWHRPTSTNERRDRIARDREYLENCVLREKDVLLKAVLVVIDSND